MLPFSAPSQRPSAQATHATRTMPPTSALLAALRPRFDVVSVFLSTEDTVLAVHHTRGAFIAGD